MALTLRHQDSLDQSCIQASGQHVGDWHEHVGSAGRARRPAVPPVGAGGRRRGSWPRSGARWGKAVKPDGEPPPTCVSLQHVQRVRVSELLLQAIKGRGQASQAGRGATPSGTHDAEAGLAVTHSAHVGLGMHWSSYWFLHHFCGRGCKEGNIEGYCQAGSYHCHASGRTGGAGAKRHIAGV